MPVELSNQVIGKFSPVWEAAGPFQNVIVLMIPTIAWLLRKPVANLLLKAANAIANGLGLSLSDDFKNSIAPGGRVLVVATGGLIANDVPRYS